MYLNNLNLDNYRFKLEPDFDETEMKFTAEMIR